MIVAPDALRPTYQINLRDVATVRPRVSAIIQRRVFESRRRGGPGVEIMAPRCTGPIVMPDPLAECPFYQKPDKNE
jgi:hypothetical protein